MRFLFPLLERLSDGDYLRRILALCLRALAALVALGWLLALIGVLKIAFNSNAPASASVAGLAVAALIVAAAAAMIQVLLFRAERVSEIESGAYVMIGIASHIFRMFGEIVAVFLLTVGACAFVAAVVAGSAAARMLGPLVSGPLESLVTSSTGAGGFIALLVNMFFAFIAIVTSYLGAEFLEIGRGIAADVRSLSSGSPRFPAAGEISCPECRRMNTAGDAYCVNCGAPLKATVPIGAVR